MPNLLSYVSDQSTFSEMVNKMYIEGNISNVFMMCRKNPKTFLADFVLTVFIGHLMLSAEF